MALPGYTLGEGRTRLILLENGDWELRNRENPAALLGLVVLPVLEYYQYHGRKATRRGSRGTKQKKTMFSNTWD